MELRAYQIEGIKAVQRHWDAGHRNVLAVAPTGAGKGTMAVSMLVDAATQGQRSLFIVHLRDVAEDIAERVRNEGARVGMVLPGHPRDADAPVQVASVQSLPNLEAQRFDLAVVDEAHHYRADEWQAVIEAVDATRMVGFTATPQRSDGKGLGDVFTELVAVVSYSELLALGHIVPCRVMVPPRKLNGDLAMGPAEAYLEYAKGTSAFIFVRSLQSAESVRAKLKRAKVAAEIVRDDTPYKDRSVYVEALKTGWIDVIINYATMTEGVDAPIVSTVVLEQPTKHESSFIQRVGRALRAHPGKTSALLLDLPGACYQHGIPGQDREYTLRGKEPMRLAGVEVLNAAPTKAEPSVVGTGLMEVDAAWLARNGGPRVVDWSRVDWSRTLTEIARDLGLSLATVAKRAPSDRKRSSRPPDPRLGMMRDSELARIVGIDEKTIREQRKALGIPAFSPHRSAYEALTLDERLGAISDRVLAEEYRVPIHVVVKSRKKRGLPGIARGEPASRYSCSYHKCPRPHVLIEQKSRVASRRGMHMECHKRSVVEQRVCRYEHCDKPGVLLGKKAHRVGSTMHATCLAASKRALVDESKVTIRICECGASVTAGGRLCLACRRKRQAAGGAKSLGRMARVKGRPLMPPQLCRHCGKTGLSKGAKYHSECWEALSGVPTERPHRSTISGVSKAEGPVENGPG